MRWMGLLALIATSSVCFGQATLYRDLGQLEQALGESLCRVDFNRDGLLKASEPNGVNFNNNPLSYDGPPPNSGQGPVLTFDQAPPFFTLQTLQPGANFTFDDDEGAGNVPSFDNALSIGDIDNHENDDFRLSLPAGTTAMALGFQLNDSNGAAGESLRLLDSGGGTIQTIPLDGTPDGNSFIGFIASTPVAGFEFNEDAGGDDVAIGAVFLPSCSGPDSYEPDGLPELGHFVEDFDFYTDDFPGGNQVVEQVRNLGAAGDVDWTIFATTVNYPTNSSWPGATNTRLYLQLCQGACDGIATAALNLQMFDFDLVEFPQTATPVFELNSCPGGLNDEVERELPIFRNDETFFVRVSACDGASDVDYRLLLRRNAVGIDLHVVRGTVQMFGDGSQLMPAPAYAVIRSNYNDFTFANPADGTYAIALLANDFNSGQPVTDLDLTVTLFNAPFEATQTRPVIGMTPGTAQVIDFTLNLFRNGFEDPQ